MNILCVQCARCSVHFNSHIVHIVYFPVYIRDLVLDVLKFDFCQTICTVSTYNTQCNRNSLQNITVYSITICFMFRRFLVVNTWPRDRFLISSLSPTIQIPAQYFKLYQNHFLASYFQCIILQFSYCLKICNLSCLKCC